MLSGTRSKKDVQNLVQRRILCIRQAVQVYHTSKGLEESREKICHSELLRVHKKSVVIKHSHERYPNAFARAVSGQE